MSIIIFTDLFLIFNRMINSYFKFDEDYVLSETINLRIIALVFNVRYSISYRKRMEFDSRRIPIFNCPQGRD